MRVRLLALAALAVSMCACSHNSSESSTAGVPRDDLENSAQTDFGIYSKRRFSYCGDVKAQNSHGSLKDWYGFVCVIPGMGGTVDGLRFAPASDAKGCVIRSADLMYNPQRLLSSFEIVSCDTKQKIASVRLDAERLKELLQQGVVLRAKDVMDRIAFDVSNGEGEKVARITFPTRTSLSLAKPQGKELMAWTTKFALFPMFYDMLMTDRQDTKLFDRKTLLVLGATITTSLTLPEQDK